MIEWTTERIGQLSTDQIKSLRENASKRSEDKVVELCTAELAKRKPTRPKTQRANPVATSHEGEVVGGFHFVCPKEKGVERNPDSTFWTGTWVVDEAHAEQAPQIPAYVALHTTKSEPSYLQGTVRGYRKTSRQPEYAEGRPVKIETGIDFLLAPTTTSYAWHGDGAGEKGYLWILVNKNNPIEN